jgi:hypothetical protein
VETARNAYATAHGLPAKNEPLDWADMRAGKRVVTTAPTLE